LNKKNIITIIPARGGSKGIPNKNITIFNNKPLLAHSIDYAKSSNLVSSIYVSTDNQKISKIAIKNKAKVINRPDSISGDEATTESAISHLLENLDYTPEIIILLQPTSPLRPPKSLDKALKLFIEKKYDSLLSISPTHRFFWSIKNGKAIPKYDFLNRPRRQDLDSSSMQFVENGSLYIFTYKSFVENKNRLGGHIGHIIFNEEYSYEIDTPKDLIFLESLVKILNPEND